MNRSTKIRRVLLSAIAAALAVFLGCSPATAVTNTKVTNIAGSVVYIDNQTSTGTKSYKVGAYDLVGVSISDLDAIRVSKPWHESYSNYSLIVWVNDKRYDENDGYFWADAVVPVGAKVRVAAFHK